MKTEVLIIGGGPGGYVAAIKLGQLEKKVLLVDRDKLGGECLNYGCIPSKALISAASLVHKARKAKEIGIFFGEPSVDMAKVQQWKNAVLQGMNRGVLNLTQGNGAEFLQGEVRFTGPTSAEIKTSQRTEKIEFQNALIAAGSRSTALPGFEFGGNILGSKESLDLVEIPKRLLVIGGGVIGLEIGTFYAKLGSQVAVVEMMPQILPGIEPDLVQPVARSLQKLGVAVHLNSKPLTWSKNLSPTPSPLAGEGVGEGGELSIQIQTPDGGKTVLADKILVCIGRKPNIKDLGLEAAGVQTNSKGFITVDAAYKTSAKGIHAVGDVIGPPFLAHKASREGILAATAIAGGKPEPLGAIPWAVFTDPEVAFVGLTEAGARENGREVRLGRFPFAASGRAVTTRESDGFVKIISDKGTGEILGVGIVGPQASDLIGEACLAIRLKATVQDLASTIHPHPTLPEALMEASEAALGQPIHILTKRN